MIPTKRVRNWQISEKLDKEASVEAVCAVRSKSDVEKKKDEADHGSARELCRRSRVDEHKLGENSSVSTRAL
jgi:hypothetical protein